MKKEVAEQWVAALRSGKYQQGHRALQRAGNMFCCLGVLCDISGLGEWKYRSEHQTYEYGGEFGAPTAGVKEWSGITKTGILIEMNDERQMSFKQIADYIEQHWETL